MWHCARNIIKSSNSGDREVIRKVILTIRKQQRITDLEGN
jgi:hypothetical protein